LSSEPLRRAYLAFALLGAAVLGAFVYDRAFRAPPASAPAAPVAANPAGASPAGASPAAAPKATVPVERPDVALKDLTGQLHSLAEWSGKALVINFWATWCAPCRREIPLLNKIEREYASKGVEVVGIAVDFADDVRAFTKDFPIGYPLLIGEEDGLAAARAFGVETMAFPFTAFTDNRGRIITVHMGELHPLEAQAILGVVTRVDAGELTPDGARAAVKAALDALPSTPTPASSPAQG
jgi:thiol-disulfide isomerase/thioredoxin